MAADAAARFCAGDRLAQYLAEQRDSFSMGRVLYLDEWLAAPADRVRLLGLLDAATVRLLRVGAFTDYGCEWVASVVAELRAQVAGGSPDVEPAAAADGGS